MYTEQYRTHKIQITREPLMSTKKTAEEQAREIERILAEAMKEPGVAEVVAAYNSWRMADDEYEPVRQAMQITIPTSTSNCTKPLTQIRA